MSPLTVMSPLSLAVTWLVTVTVAVVTAMTDRGDSEERHGVSGESDDSGDNDELAAVVTTQARLVLDRKFSRSQHG
jgi:hypothetical protein